MIFSHVRFQKITGGQKERDGKRWAVFALVAFGCPFVLPERSFAQAPMGACCDPYNTECNAGRNEGRRCLSNADCAAPGTCEAVCRQTTEANCPFPPPDSEMRPQWQEGAACSPDPFGHTPCGVAACCHKKPSPQNPDILDEVCENLTRNECEAAEPLDEPRLWQLGEYCGLGAQQCPRNACLRYSGPICDPIPCYPCFPDPFPDIFCCGEICSSGPVGAFCCNVAWDSVCCELAREMCPIGPPNDQCAPNDPKPNQGGALLISFPGSSAINNLNASTDDSEPGFCCHNGTGECVGGSNAGAMCVVDQDCPSEVCSERTPDPTGKGFGSIWFKFVLPAGVTTAGIHTCTSNAPAMDSLLQVFAAADHSSQAAECNSLIPIACNDDAPNCGSTGRNSRLCLKDLTPGETYYILVAAKTENRRGQYRVSISTTCTGAMESCTPCPEGEVEFVDPPDGVVDARRPHKPDGPDSRQGIRTFHVSGPSAAKRWCWSFCESGPETSVHIAEIIEQQPGTYRIELDKPITTAATAFLSYRDDHGHKWTGRFLAHPANVNGDGQAVAGDVLALIDHLNGLKMLPWGRYSADIDRSGAVSPADILALIDLLNGTNGFAAWYGTALPDGNECP